MLNYDFLVCGGVCIWFKVIQWDIQKFKAIFVLLLFPFLNKISGI